jgi:hypothetical protein
MQLYAAHANQRGPRGEAPSYLVMKLLRIFISLYFAHTPSVHEKLYFQLF